MYKRQGVGKAAPNARDGNLLVLNRLAQHLQRLPVELRQFIQKPVSYTHLDVYKRQIPTLSATSAQMSRMPDPLRGCKRDITG